MALLQIQANVLASRLEAAGTEGTTLRGANGEDVHIRALSDATLVASGLSMREMDPEDILDAVHARLGEVMDLHTDDRGVLLFPKAAMPQGPLEGTTYAGAVSEVAEMGEWVSIDNEDEDGAAPGAEPGGIAALAGDLMSQLGPDVVSLQERMMAGDPAAMQEAMAQVGALLSDPTKKDALMNAVSALSGGAAGNPLAGLGANLPPGTTMPNPAELMKNMDMGALREQAQKMMADNPNLEHEVREQLEKKKSDK